ncbi:glycosyltransferase [candidate division WOR-3 bacterium]|uniref:Glycosyltransferase n=1 Tax=candidate division WOR-3 bacterium TaxID=2052148 RepID=A0A937XDK3_UNCW3|nr:glycosyltransferase [candidate division WOR-3 bacterium]
MKNRTAQFSKIAFIGNYVPRRCGIATFTTDICESVAREAPDAECVTAAMNDTVEGYDYPDRVRFEVAQNDLDEYRQLADFLNLGRVDLVCMQHEYGIFGGSAGSHLLLTQRRLRMPVVTTLHTVLREPDDMQRQVLTEICHLSDRVVVMSERSRQYLADIYEVSPAKIDLIHHGIPDMPFVDPNFYKDLFGVEGRRVILTFGLLSPNKGIENVIRALPAVVERFPDVVYIVLGVTHPHVLREKGEEYRISLQRLARELGVSDHVVYYNRFVDIKELCQFLGAADLYVTPYLNPVQAVSGTLAYATGTGKAVVSTPYWYAEELLAEGRGRLVPFNDHPAMAETVVRLFANEAERHAMRKQAYAYGRQMIWKEVARSYLDTFQRAAEERVRGPVFVDRVAVESPLDMELPRIDLKHLLTLTDDTGIIQHARNTVPNLNEGYTTDDNSRALIVALRALEHEKDTAILHRLVGRYLAFIDYAFNRTNRRFRNFLGYDRRWLEDTGSEDSHGRALWSLGTVVGASHDDAFVALAMNLFDSALHAVELFSSPRAWAYTLLGVCSYIKRFPGASNARRIRDALAQRLLEMYRTAASDDWPWFERSLAYGNARLSHALIRAGADTGNQEMTAAGLRSLDWLFRVETAEAGNYSPIPNSGWQRGAPRPRFDQQPIEAQCMVEASFRAWRVTKDRRWREAMTTTFEWFLGRNDLGRPVYDYATGGCHDGLHPEGVNSNEGAESTLAFLGSLLTLRRAETVGGEGDR